MHHDDRLAIIHRTPHSLCRLWLYMYILLDGLCYIVNNIVVYCKYHACRSCVPCYATAQASSAWLRRKPKDGLATASGTLAKTDL